MLIFWGVTWFLGGQNLSNLHGFWGPWYLQLEIKLWTIRTQETCNDLKIEKLAIRIDLDIGVQFLGCNLR